MDTYSVKEIADMLNTNPETVRRWIRSGKLEAIQESRKGGNVVTKAMLDAFLKNSPKYAGIGNWVISTTSWINNSYCCDCRRNSCSTAYKE